MAGNANDNLDWYLGTEETALSPLLIPELNQGFLGSCDGLDQYAKLFGLVYSTLENKTVFLRNLSFTSVEEGALNLA